MRHSILLLSLTASSLFHEILDLTSDYRPSLCWLYGGHYSFAPDLLARVGDRHCSTPGRDLGAGGDCAHCGLSWNLARGNLLYRTLMLVGALD